MYFQRTQAEGLTLRLSVAELQRASQTASTPKSHIHTETEAARQTTSSLRKNDSDYDEAAGDPRSKIDE